MQAIDYATVQWNLLSYQFYEEFWLWNQLISKPLLNLWTCNGSFWSSFGWFYSWQRFSTVLAVSLNLPPVLHKFRKHLATIRVCKKVVTWSAAHLYLYCHTCILLWKEYLGVGCISIYSNSWSTISGCLQAFSSVTMNFNFFYMSAECCKEFYFLMFMLCPDLFHMTSFFMRYF